MLQDPPCIRGLLGCSDGNDSGSSFTENGLNGGDSSLSDSSGTTSSQSGGDAEISTDTSLGTLADRFSSGGERVARYTVSAVNRGSDAVTGFTFAHGPLPSGVVFDPSRSSKYCTSAGTDVQCTLGMQPGESSTTEIAYTVNSSFSCAIARVLQRVRNVTAGAQPTVATSVTCGVKTEGAATAGTDTVITDQHAMYLGQPTNAASIVMAQPYELPVIRYVQIAPRSGVADVLFQSRSQDHVLTRVIPDTSSSVSSHTFILGVAIVALIIGALVFRVLRARSF